MAQIIALIGHPVAHSVSPAMQQAALDTVGVDARYEAWDTRPEDLRVAFERLRSGDVLGANVTVPHKVEAMRLVDRVEPPAERARALNTVIRTERGLEGTNTDIAGILHALREGGVEVRGARVVLLGAGGAARAVVVAMRQGGARLLTVANRTVERAEELVSLGGDELEVRALPLDEGEEQLREAVREAAIVVQSTSLGMLHGPDEDASPIPGEWFARGQAAFDIVYAPERTPFLDAAERAGARTVGGLAMLVHQGAESFRLWTGQEAPVKVMLEAARAALAVR